MPNDPVDEIAGLAAQISEQLAFFREIGVTDIGGSIEPPSSSAVESAFKSGSPEFVTMAGASKESIGITDEDMKLEGETAAQQAHPGPPLVNLFGEVVAPATTGRNVRTRSSAGETDTIPETWSNRSLEEIRSDLGECTRCRLHEHRTNIVFGEGNPAAELVFVGEGPGADEDRTGRPFVGKAGKLLDRIIEAIGMKRAEVYIANVVKCRPPENRTPERDEAATCGPFLFRQPGFIRPKVIVALGAPALHCLTGSREGITKVRGQWQIWQGIKVMPTYHPAYLLRVPDKKKETWEDMKKVRDYITNGEFLT